MNEQNDCFSNDLKLLPEKLRILSFVNQLSTLSTENKIILYLRWEHRQQALQSSRCLISTTHDCEKLCWYLRKNKLSTLFQHFDMKTESGTMKTHASDTLSPPVSVSPLSVTRLNCSLRNTHSVSHQPNQPLDQEEKWNRNDLYNWTELELIKYPVSSFLWEIASVFRCVKNKAFRDNIFKPYYCKIPVIKLTVLLIRLKITCIESRTS